jgi:hypothetical protein
MSRKVELEQGFAVCDVAELFYDPTTWRRFGTDFALEGFEIVRRNAGGFPLGVLG